MLLCPRCFYNLTGLTSDRCPECGFSDPLQHGISSDWPLWARRDLGGPLRRFVRSLGALILSPRKCARTWSLEGIPLRDYLLWTFLACASYFLLMITAAFVVAPWWLHWLVVMPQFRCYLFWGFSRNLAYQLLSLMIVSLWCVSRSSRPCTTSERLRRTQALLALLAYLPLFAATFVLCRAVIGFTRFALDFSVLSVLDLWIVAALVLSGVHVHIWAKYALGLREFDARLAGVLCFIVAAGLLGLSQPLAGFAGSRRPPIGTSVSVVPPVLQSVAGTDGWEARFLTGKKGSG